MPAKRLPWIKFWPELLEHEKFAVLSPAECWGWVVVWSKASLQAERWRYANVKHAIKVTGQTERLIRRLIQMHLLDEREDGLWVHDWQEWQNVYPSDYEDGVDADHQRRVRHGSSPEDRTLRQRSVNAPSTLPDDSRNGASTLREDSANAPNDPLETGDVRRETGELSPPAPTGQPSPSAAIREPVPKPTPAPTPVGTLLDKIKALDPDLAVFGDQGFTGRKLKENPTTDLNLVAEAYVSYRHGEWPGSKMLRESGSLAWVIGDLGGYVEWKSGPRRAMLAAPQRPGVRHA